MPHYYSGRIHGPQRRTTDLLTDLSRKAGFIDRYPGETGKAIWLGMEIADSPKVDRYSSGGEPPPLVPFLLRKGVAKIGCLGKEGN